ncbi:MAG: M14 family metallopeptidase [Planctomycetota bacterium]
MTLCAVVDAQEPAVPLLTAAERSNYTQTMTSDEVRAFLDALREQTDLVTISSIGTTTEGRDIPLAIIADPPVSDPRVARGTGKLVVLLIGNIHAGEVCGKEALLMLARDLTLGDVRPLLNDLVICIIPNYNPDGNDRFDADNRPGQVGPEEMGTRHNAHGLDLNRDYVKLDARETRALIRFQNTWDPAVIVDTHTTNGSHHRFVLTYQGPKHPSSDPKVLRYVRDTMLPAIDAAFERETGEQTFFYGNFTRDHSKWVTYPDLPRYGVAYRGMRNRLSILSEAYAYATYQQRVIATYDFCLEVLRYSARHREKIATMAFAADRRTLLAGRDPEGAPPVVVRSEVRPFERPVTISGYVMDESGEPGEPTEHVVEFWNDFVATETVERAYAYLIPAEGYLDIARKLRQHGISVQRLQRETEIDVESYRIDVLELQEREYQKRTRLAAIEVTPEARREEFAKGTLVVRTAQPLGTLASYMLEPRAADGLAAWGLMNDRLRVGGEFPFLRVPAKVSLPLEPAPR